MDTDIHYMQLALALARRGLGSTSPNPMVGAVLVQNDTILAEGFHRKAGEGHAEVDALSKISTDTDLRDATLYVTLEPCTHHGRTPPCCDLLIDRGVGTVVIGASDVNPLTAGKAAARLIDAGISVREGVLERECIALNKRYYTYQRLRRPYLILKWAETEDGFIAREDGSSKWISSELARTEVHRMRSIEDGILVGTRTALLDNPQLTTRMIVGDNPVRIVLDRNLSIPRSHAVYNSDASSLIFNALRTEQLGTVTLVQVPFDGYLLEPVLQELYRRGICSVLVEGGRAVLQSFIDQDLWDEAHVFIGDCSYQTGIPAPVLHAAHSEERRFGSTLCRSFVRQAEQT